MFVEKYKPKQTNELFGQGRNIARIKSWLKTYDSSRSQPLFIYGPPGIGKTTAAHLCCREVGYKTVEFNASDQRNKNIIREVIGTVVGNSRLNFFGRASETKDAIILDEVDGMAGNEDRGGIAQIMAEFKNVKKPMILICNDGQHQKLRSLKEKCEVIEFRKPEYEVIKALVQKIASREGIPSDCIDIQNLAESSGYDIRQILNTLYLFKASGSKEVTKTTKLNAFDATKSALTASVKHTLESRFDCFFADYNIVPLFMHENYARVPWTGKGNHLKFMCKAADALCLSDLADKEIRSNQNWSLLNVQALLSTVIPSKLMATNFIGRIEFPQFLGKLSNANKRLRLTQELNAHMCLKLRNGLDPDYLEVMQRRLSAPLIAREKLGGIDTTIGFMQEYSLLREDFNSIMELASWSDQPDPMAKVDSKTKTAFTLAYKKKIGTLPYFHEEKIAKKRTPAAAALSGEMEEEEDDEEEVEEVIKPKRTFAKDTAPKKGAGKKEAPKKEATKKNGVTNGVSKNGIAKNVSKRLKAN